MPGGPTRPDEILGLQGNPVLPVRLTEIIQCEVGIFDQALEADAGSHFAAAGKSRALLNLGDYQAAAQAVSGVRTSFVCFVGHSENSNREQMPLFALQDVGRFSVANREGATV